MVALSTGVQARPGVQEGLVEGPWAVEVEGFLPAVALSISKRLLAEVVKACIGEGLAVRWQELFLYCCMLVLAATAQEELIGERAVPAAWEERAALPWVQAPQQEQASIALAQMIDAHREAAGATAYKEGAQAVRWLVLDLYCCKPALVVSGRVELVVERGVPAAWVVRVERAVQPWVQAPQQVQASIAPAQMIGTHREATGAAACKEGAQAGRWLVLVPRCCKLALVKRSVVLEELAAQAWELPSLGPEVEVVAGLLELLSQLEQAEEALTEGQLQVTTIGMHQGARVEAALLKEERVVHSQARVPYCCKLARSMMTLVALEGQEVGPV